MMFSESKRAYDTGAFYDADSPPINFYSIVKAYEERQKVRHNLTLKRTSQKKIF
jgi:hypothetical protein